MIRASATIAFFVLTVASIFVAAVSSVEAQSTDVTINIRPHRDLSVRLKDEIRSGRLDIASPFSIEVDAVLNDRGRLDGKLSKVASSTGDKAAVAAAKDAIEAFGDAGWYQYIKQLGASSFTLRVEQDSYNFTARIIMPFESDSRARTTAKALNSLFQVSKVNLQTSASDEIRNETSWLLEGVSTGQNGNNVTVVIQRPAERFRAILLRNLGI